MESENKNLQAEAGTSDKGQVVIADDVINVIAQLAISDIDGIDKMLKKGRSKSIGVVTEGNDISFTVDLVIPYGTKVPDFAGDIQSRIKTSVENMTGMNVKEVTVNVTGMNIEKSAKES